MIMRTVCNNNIFTRYYNDLARNTGTIVNEKPLFSDCYDSAIYRNPVIKRSLLLAI